MKSKKYLSRDWLILRYEMQGKTPEEIAEECGVVPITIYRTLWRFGILKKKQDNPRKLYGKYFGKEIR